MCITGKLVNEDRNELVNDGGKTMYNGQEGRMGVQGGRGGHKKRIEDESRNSIGQGRRAGGPVGTELNQGTTNE